MTHARNLNQYRQLLHQIDPHASLLTVAPLTGGVSATVMALDVVWSDGQIDKLVVRQHGAIDRARNPHIARDEFRVLQRARAQGILVPTPYHVDESCSIFPQPVVVVACVNGATEFAPADLDGYLSQAATQLAKIHRLSPRDLSFLPTIDQTIDSPPPTPDDVMSETTIRAALASAWYQARTNETVVLHGDYWPGNLLWREGALVAVLDWEDACLGDPLADLGNIRLELLWLFGLKAMETFTQRYCAEREVDLTNLPYWDLRAALRPCGKLTTWGLESETERRMIERHAVFVDAAIETFSQRGISPR